jgi:hypothetical protein
MSSIQSKRGQVCDNCRFRKVKCDRGLPCKNCHIGDLRCQYRHSIRRKGPKQGQGRRQTQLRQGLGTSDTCQFQILTPEVPPGSRQSRSCEDAVPAQAQTQPVPQSRPSQPTNIEDAPLQLDPDITKSNNGSTLDTGDLCKRMSFSLVAHIQLFQRFLYPISLWLMTIFSLTQPD